MKRESKQTIINIAIQEYLNIPESDRSLTQIGRKYGIKRQTLSKYLKLRGYEVINYQNIHRLNETIFDTIDTEEKAYWLGFLYADGNISSEGFRLEINLSITDLNHMKKLATFLNLTNDIRLSANGEICRISARSKHLWEQLNIKGCTPCKSLTLKFPNAAIFSNSQLIYDFIRGYCDGDGCLTVYKKNNSVVTELNFVGTENFLLEVEKKLNIKGYIRNKSSMKYINRAYSLKYSGVAARRVARLLYEKASIYLDRKYNKYKLFCLLEEGSSRRKSSKIGEGWDANTEITN